MQTPGCQTLQDTLYNIRHVEMQTLASIEQTYRNVECAVVLQLFAV